MEQEEKDSVATGNACGCPCWHRTHRRYSYSRHDYRHPCICGEEGEALEAQCLYVHIYVPLVIVFTTGMRQNIDSFG